jgi:cyclohexyl-isocyanide hydratase
VREAIGDAAIVEFVREQAKAANLGHERLHWCLCPWSGGIVAGQTRNDPLGATRNYLPLFGATHEKARVVRDGNLVTAGGVTSGIDFALELMALAQGEDVARTSSSRSNMTLPRHLKAAILAHCAASGR